VSTVREDLAVLLNQPVVLDTFGPIVYLGTLAEVTDSGFWLIDADVHDCRDGHASKELYVLDARRDGIRPNRARVFVLQSGIASVSRLEDVRED
jgi:hypothetical protein